MIDNDNSYLIPEEVNQDSILDADIWYRHVSDNDWGDIFTVYDAGEITRCPSIHISLETSNNIFGIMLYYSSDAKKLESITVRYNHKIIMTLQGEGYSLDTFINVGPNFTILNDSEIKFKAFIDRILGLKAFL